VLRHVERNLGIGLVQTAEKLRIPRNRLRPILDLLLAKGLVRRLGHGKQTAYYPTRVGGLPINAKAHHARSRTEYAILLRLLETLGKACVADLGIALQRSQAQVLRLVQLAQRDGIRVVLEDDARWAGLNH
jgi:hypothetical protein